MGKTPGKWIKTLLLGKKSPKSNLENRSDKLKSAKKEDPMVSGTEDLSNLPVYPPVVSSQPVSAPTAQDVGSPNNGEEWKENIESRNDMEELKLEHAALKVQAAFRAHQARRAFRTLKGIIRLQAVIRGHLVRRQAIATYSCIWGIVKFQALVRGQKARSSDNGIQCQKTHKEAGDLEALQSSSCSWMVNPTKLAFVDKLLACSPTAFPMKIQYGPQEPNSAEVWLERWTQLQVWSSGSRVAKIEIPKPQSKKRNYEAVVEAEMTKPKRGTKKLSVPNSGTGSSRSTAESGKPKRNVRNPSMLSKDPLKTESDKVKPNSRKSRSAPKEGSPLEIKDVKPNSNAKRSSLSNGPKKATLKASEKKKDTAASVQIEPEGKVLKEGDNIEFVEKEKDTADSVQIEPEGKVLKEGDNIEFAEKEKDTADSGRIEPEGKVLKEGDNIEFAEKEKDTAGSGRKEPEGKVLEEGDNIEFAEKEKNTADSVQIETGVEVSGKVLEGGDNVGVAENGEKTADCVQIEPEGEISGKVLEGEDNFEFDKTEKDTSDVVPKAFDVITDEQSQVSDKQGEDESKTAVTNDKVEDLKSSDVKVSSENVNVGSGNTKPNETPALPSANIENHDDGITHSGRKIPSYMAPTASAKARVKGEYSPGYSQEKTEKNGAVRRHSLPSPANGKLSTTTMFPRAHKLHITSAKGSMSGNKSFTSSKDKSGKSTRTEWKR